jgi:hypothetical protein
VKIVLGWRLDTRRLLITLPDDKFNIWNKEIEDMSTRNYCTRKELEILIRKLNHAALVIPLPRHFLGELRYLLRIAKHDKSILKLNKRILSLLQLWMRYLHRANAGIDLNMISNRAPTNIIVTDACPGGLEGFSARTGFAWSLLTPPETPVSNNILEFAVSIVGILIELDNKVVPDMCQVLAVSDNTS